MIRPEKDIRDAFFDEVYAQGAADPRVTILTNDMDVFSLRRFKQDFPERFIDVGVAEQNMMTVAAGLASCGRKVLVFGISPFVSFRCFEQIKFAICSMNLPVVIAGVGPGFSFSFDGPTHHGTHDLAVMRSLPEMAIYNPGDTGSAVAAARRALSAETPVYVRIDKGPFPELYTVEEALAQGFKILRPLASANIVATGQMTQTALAVAEDLSAQGFELGVVDIFELKPISGDFLSQVVAKSSGLVTLEENALTGGLGTILAEAIAGFSPGIRLLRLAAEDRQVLDYGDREYLRRENGLDPASIRRAIADFFAQSALRKAG